MVFYGRKTLNERRIAFIFCCSVAPDLWVLSFSPTDDLQDPVCYSTKLVLIVKPPLRLVYIGNTHDFCGLQVTSQVEERASSDCK